MNGGKDTERLALRVLEENRVAVFIVAYNAEKHIGGVLNRIPGWIAERLAEIYIIDDHSADNTVGAAELVAWPKGNAPLRIYRTPYNQGYGGNQRLGYMYAIERGIDIVVLLHGDGQYAPEFLPEILAPYAEGADAVFGSRFLDGFGALRGGMPFYKWAGNRVLTKVQNLLLGSRLSELHSGYRSYRASALKKIPFHCNSPWFDFDADIIIQLHGAGLKIVEVPVPTFYGDEICHVNGMLYAFRCVKAAVKYRLMQYEIFYDPKYAVGKEPVGPRKERAAATSVRHFAKGLPIRPGSKILDVGGSDGDAVAKAHSQKGGDVTRIGGRAFPEDSGIKQFVVDLDGKWADQFPIERYETVFALDVLGHLRSPEAAARQLFECMKPGGKLFVGTGNVVYLPLRFMFLIGFFNYGRRGILDLTHCRLFTLGSFRRLLRNAGFRVDKAIGFGPPLRELIKGGVFQPLVLGFLDWISAGAARFWPGPFAYRVLFVCTRTDAVEDLMRPTFEASKPS
ncbi:MAG: bifunctional glycosyltransferase/class I SAM-dependent methyltransferase [Syntrophobacteraceae bacterium]